MKKFGYIILTAVMLAVLSLGAYAAENQLALATKDKSSVVEPGDTFEVEIDVSENQGFIAAVATVEFDGDALSYVEYSLKKSDYSPVTVYEQQGRLKVTIGDLLAGISSPDAVVFKKCGKVVTLTFKAKEDFEGMTQIKIELTGGDVLTPDQDVSYTAVSGCVHDVQVAKKGAHVHEIEVLPGRDATCTEDGMTEGRKCSDCGEIIVAQEKIPALGHTYSPEMKSDANSHWSVCLRCGENSSTVPHEFKKGVCTACGYKDPSYDPSTDTGDDTEDNVQSARPGETGSPDDPAQPGTPGEPGNNGGTVNRPTNPSGSGDDNTTTKKTDWNDILLISAVVVIVLAVAGGGVALIIMKKRSHK